MLLLLLTSLLGSLVSHCRAQDTYHCPDGWFYQEAHGSAHCFFFSMSQVSKEEAKLLCAGHGGWLAEPDRPSLNYWIKHKLLELYTPNLAVPWGNMFWLGAVTEDHHSDHVNGNWRWEHANTSVEWFDWGDHEPNDYHTQNCLTFMEYRNPIFQNIRDYFWNDADCLGYETGLNHYICTKPCADCKSQH